MGWMSWIIGGVATAGGLAAKEIIANAGKKHLEEPYEAKKKAKEELVDDFELEELIRLEEEADKEEPAPKKSRKKKD